MTCALFVASHAVRTTRRFVRLVAVVVFAVLTLVLVWARRVRRLCACRVLVVVGSGGAGSSSHWTRMVAACRAAIRAIWVVVVAELEEAVMARRQVRPPPARRQRLLLRQPRRHRPLRRHRNRLVLRRLVVAPGRLVSLDLEEAAVQPVRISARRRGTTRACGCARRNSGIRCRR